MSLKKKTRTAASVPSWTTAVNDAPASAPNHQVEKIRRWPEEETGRNSVSPWSADSTMTWIQDMPSSVGAARTVVFTVRLFLVEVGHGRRSRRTRVPVARREGSRPALIGAW